MSKSRLCSLNPPPTKQTVFLPLPHSRFIIICPSSVPSGNSKCKTNSFVSWFEYLLIFERYRSSIFPSSSLIFTLILVLTALNFSFSSVHLPKLSLSVSALAKSFCFFLIKSEKIPKDPVAQTFHVRNYGTSCPKLGSCKNVSAGLI